MAVAWAGFQPIAGEPLGGFEEGPGLMRLVYWTSPTELPEDLNLAVRVHRQ